MRICRYNDDKLGLVKGDQLIDVTIALENVSKSGPELQGDAMIANIDAIRVTIEEYRKIGYVQGVDNVVLKSPVANSSKIISATAKYRDYVAESQDDAELKCGHEINTINENGLFLRENPTLVGPGEGIALGHADPRNDYEIELAVIIGTTANNVDYDDALDLVAGYSMGFSNTAHGILHHRVGRYIESRALLGPWITTADEIDNPDDLGLRITVNGEVRQDSNTKYLMYDCRTLIEHASKLYTLYPGDILLTGTNKGVGPIEPGDRLVCQLDTIGKMELEIR